MVMCWLANWTTPLLALLVISPFPNRCQPSNTHMYEYSKSKSNLPFNVGICVNSYVRTLSQCASLASGSKTATFFYNKGHSQCQWNCTFSYPGSCSTMCMSPWAPYGMYMYVLQIMQFPEILKLSLSTERSVVD